MLLGCEKSLSPDNIYATSNSVEKLGQAWGSFTISVRSLQFVPKLWHDECWSMLSIAHCSASTSECKAVYHLLKFRVSISWIFPRLSFQTHPQPQNWTVEVHEPSTIQIFSKLIGVLHWYAHVEWVVPSHLHYTEPDIHFQHIGITPKDPCLSPWIVCQPEPFKYTRLSMGKGPCQALAQQCYSSSRRDNPY